MNSLDTFLWPVLLTSQEVITNFVRVSLKIGVVEADENSSWALFHFLFAAKIHKFEFS